MPRSNLDKQIACNNQTPPLDRWFWLAMLLAAAIVIPRCMLISRASSETLDEPAHIQRGLTIAHGNPGQMSIQMNDPPFGDVLIVLPMLLMHANPADPIVWSHWPGGKPATLPNLRPELARHLRIIRQEVLYGYAVSPEALLLAIAIWKAILFVPFAALVFHIARWLYGLHAGWLALAMLLIDPTVAAHTGLATLDVIGVESIVFACYVGWQYFQNPTRWGLIATAATCGLALSIKHTAVAVPPILFCYAAAFFLQSKIRNPKSKIHFRSRLNDLLLALLIILLILWASTLFDFSTPRNWMWPISYEPGGAFQFIRDFFDPLLDLHWPGGIYVGSFLGGLTHAHRGHWSFLLGQNNPDGGWWYYFPVVAAFKIPLGFFLVFLLALFSLTIIRPKFTELFALIPVVIFCLLLFTTKIDIGFRHFLPPLVFIYILAARCLSAFSVQRSAFFIILAWFAATAAFADTVPYYPNYLSYINYPYKEPWRIFADSNIDWGQSIKQVRTWLDTHPTEQPVYLVNFISDMPAEYYLDHRVKLWNSTRGIPPTGTLIISPNCVDGIFDWFDSFRALRSQKPIAIIGHNMLVYDLNQIHKP